ncbi:MAG: RDD family protein [Hyphomicrobiales bacterium]|nr:MAG: RDD family protein [Hyphomicrobiales bacterium]
MNGDDDLSDAFKAPPAYDPDAQPEYFAGVMWRRVFAFIIDAVVIAILWLLGSGLFLIFGILSLGLLLPLWGAFLIMLVLGYESFTLGGPYSSTFGMRMMGLEMRTWYGERPAILQAAAHSLLFYFSVTLTTFFILLVPIFDGRRRCAHDFICGTVVINNPDRRADLG